MAGRDGPALQLAMAMAASILLHLSLLVVLQPALPLQEERFSEHVVEVTLERALAAPAAPAPPAMAEAGQARPPGLIDLVHTALAPGPMESALPAQRPLAEFIHRAGVFIGVAARRSCASQGRHASVPAAGRAHAGGRNALRGGACAGYTGPGPGAADGAASATGGPPGPAAESRSAFQQPAPARRTSGPRAAAHASQRDAQQDYVLQVVRKLSQAQFSTDAHSHHSSRGALIALLTVDRGGNLIGLSLAKDSGSASVDRSILDKVRKTAPFPPLPQSLAATSFSFIVPIKYAQEP